MSIVFKKYIFVTKESEGFYIDISEDYTNKTIIERIQKAFDGEKMMEHHHSMDSQLSYLMLGGSMHFDFKNRTADDISAIKNIIKMNSEMCIHIYAHRTYLSKYRGDNEELQTLEKLLSKSFSKDYKEVDVTPEGRDLLNETMKFMTPFAGGGKSLTLKTICEENLDESLLFQTRYVREDYDGGYVIFDTKENKYYADTTKTTNPFTADIEAALVFPDVESLRETVWELASIKPHY